MRKPLLVSATLPGKPSESSHGIFRRLDMFADAVKMASGSFDALFYVPDHVDIGPENSRQIEALLRERWNTEVGVTLARRSHAPQANSVWEKYLRPAMSFHSIPEYMETSGEKQVQTFDACLDKNPSYIFVHRLRCMPPLLLTKRILPPVFFDMDDIEHVAFKRSIEMPPKWRNKWLLNLQIPALVSGEKRSMKLADRTFVCSSADKTFLGKLGEPDKIEVIPNALSIPERSSVPASRRLLVIGQYKYAPNRIGVEFFIEKVWPHILAKIPDAILVVAGPGSETIHQFGNPPQGIQFAGFVEDLDSLYNSVRVVVCPVLSGGGTRLKLIEAAAHARPIVSTTIGAEGLELENDIHAFLRDDPLEMAEACVKLLTDDTLSNRLAGAARKIAEANYERSSVSKKIADIFAAHHS